MGLHRIAAAPAADDLRYPAAIVAPIPDRLARLGKAAGLDHAQGSAILDLEINNVLDRVANADSDGDPWDVLELLLTRQPTIGVGDAIAQLVQIERFHQRLLLPETDDNQAPASRMAAGFDLCRPAVS